MDNEDAPENALEFVTKLSLIVKGKSADSTLTMVLFMSRVTDAAEEFGLEISGGINGQEVEIPE